MRSSRGRRDDSLERGGGYERSGNQRARTSRGGRYDVVDTKLSDHYTQLGDSIQLGYSIREMFGLGRKGRAWEL